MFHFFVHFENSSFIHLHVSCAVKNSTASLQHLVDTVVGNIS